MITKISPTRINLDDSIIDKVKPHLVYHDMRVDFEIKKHQKASWFKNKYGIDKWRERLDELKARRIKSLLFQDQDGYWTYSGLGPYLAEKLQVPYTDLVKYPKPESIPWYSPPDKKPRPYQETIVKELTAVKHGGIEYGTGLGKSAALLWTVKEYCLKTVIMTPSRSICDQLYVLFVKHFGQKYVGKFGDGKKEFKKQFIIAIDDSLTKVNKGDEAWEYLSGAQVFAADESHITACDTLAKVCLGVMANAPYRFFFSATQLRNDGLDLLLNAITGPIVSKMSVCEGVDQGYLAKPIFRMMNLKSWVKYDNDDVKKMMRAHLYYNPEVNEIAANIANMMIEDLNRPVVILIEELEQFSMLLPHLKHPVKFAHAQGSKEGAAKIPEAYRKSDPIQLVEDFNAGEFPILVGTSCIGMGTDVQNVQALIYLQGGKSEIKVRQAIGRGTRLCPGKTDCFMIDFDLTNIPVVHNHAVTRRVFYRETYPSIEETYL
jgi:superfamily II DNA or RNA helicase